MDRNSPPAAQVAARLVLSVASTSIHTTRPFGTRARNWWPRKASTVDLPVRGGPITSAAPSCPWWMSSISGVPPSASSCISGSHRRCGLRSGPPQADDSTRKSASWTWVSGTLRGLGRTWPGSVPYQARSAPQLSSMAVKPSVRSALTNSSRRFPRPPRRRPHSTAVGVIQPELVPACSASSRAASASRASSTPTGSWRSAAKPPTARSSTERQS